MSDPIRRVGAAGVGAPGEAGAAEGAGEAFRASLDATRPAEAVGAAGTLDAAGIGAAIRAGSLEPSAAVDALVERALSAPSARALTEPARADLERSLRAALTGDPTLATMVAELGRR
jgi:hypothetical protein